jgi:hypothetical protein
MQLRDMRISEEALQSIKENPKNQNIIKTFMAF